MITSEPGRMNTGKLRLKMANKSNILKSFLPQSVSINPDTIYYCGNTPVSTESRNLSVITCSSTVAIRSACNTFWILRCNGPVITQTVKWSILRETKALYILECTYALVLLFIVLLSYYTSSCYRQPFRKATRSLMLPWRLNPWWPVSLVGIFCRKHVTRLAA